MSGADVLPDLQRELATLKDFQRRTCDYVFRRLYLDDRPAHRFLIADEVGLGKTLVARGIIARTLHHLHRKGIGRIDVVYVCSNQDIAAQNLNRLNVTDREEIALPTRLTLLPTQIHDLESRHVNFVSLTPGTSLETTKSRQGRKEERVLLHRVLRDEPELSPGGLTNLLQCTVHRENWERYLRRMEMEIDDGLAGRFLEALRADRELWERLVETARDFRWKTERKRIPSALNGRRYRLLGDVRGLMARVCVEALEPDLIVLDEFQRFRDLLDGETEAARLTRQLLDYQEASGHRARVLLLSATPYRMLSLYGEEEDHYEDFLRTCRFLFEGSEERVEALKADLREYRQGLWRLRRDGADGSPPAGVLEEARRRVEDRLTSVMVRTERAAGTGSRDAMLAERRVHGPLEPPDLDHARTVDRVSRAVEAYDPIEYWKSAPYLLNTMRGYELKERVEERAGAPPPDLMEALRDGREHLLDGEALEAYREIDPANGRLRALLGETLEAGQWKLLWMPPSLPYLEPGGPFAEAGPTTKALVFSKWRVVPEAIAALASYSAERRMLNGGARDSRSSGARRAGPSYSRLHDGATRPLEFTIKDDRPSGMNPLMLVYPSPTLAELGDPLRLAADAGQGLLDPDAAVESMENAIRRRLREAGVELRREGGGSLPDQRWYRVALARLDARRHPEMQKWVRMKWSKAGDGFGTGFPRHAEQFAAGFQCELPQGFAPDDVVRVLAELALSSPALCAYRALRRVSELDDPTDPALLEASVRVADGFRSLYNRPGTVAFLQGRGGDLRYWERALRYGLQGNLQAVLDEYAHTLRGSLGLVDASPGRTVSEIGAAMAHSLSLGAGRVHLDEVRPRPRANRIDIETLNVRSRFALRFGHLRDERGETVARRGGVREAFNSPFRPFILATTSIGQEGLDFHTYCHAVWHWNLPSNPVDLEQREGRVHRYKGHAIRKNLAEALGLEAVQAATSREDRGSGGDGHGVGDGPSGVGDAAVPGGSDGRLGGGYRRAGDRRADEAGRGDGGRRVIPADGPDGSSESASGNGVEPLHKDPWRLLFRAAEAARPPDVNDLVPYWVFDDGPASVERRVPLLPFSREVPRLERLKSSLAVYRMVFGQPRQEDLVAYLAASGDGKGEVDMERYRISLAPAAVEMEQQAVVTTDADKNATEGVDGSMDAIPDESDEMVREIEEIVKEAAPGYRMHETGSYYGLQKDGTTENLVIVRPKTYGIRLDLRLPENAGVIRRLEDRGVEVLPHRSDDPGPGTWPVPLRPRDLYELRPLVAEALKEAGVHANL